MSRATFYLLDENVLRETGARGNARVKAWLATVDDDQLRVSAFTFIEKREGWVRHRRKLARQGKDTTEVDQRLKELTELEALYEDRQIAVDFAVGREFAELIGAKNKNQRDVMLAASARVHDLVVVTRNVADFEGRGVRVLDPFDEDPTIRKG